ncbi:MAG: GAF domain-containing protein [Deltaproteobacteria bacterium]|nr:GAF domain-containing protein [Deltaproteobacteria bacterium]
MPDDAAEKNPQEREKEISLLKRDISLKDSEIARLKEALRKFEEREGELEDERKAIIYMLEDINESTSRIETAQKEWEATFDAISSPLFIHDDGFRIVRANAAYQKIANMPFKEIIGRPYFEVFPRTGGPHLVCASFKERQKKEEGADADVEAEVAVPECGRVFKVRFYSIKSGETEGYDAVHVMEDITEAKRAEEAIKEEMEVTAHLLMIAEATARTADMDKLMEDVAHCNCRIMRSDVCLAYLWDPSSGVFRPSQEYGLDRAFLPFFRTEPLSGAEGIVKTAIETGEPVAAVTPQGTRAVQGLPLKWVKDAKTVAVVPLMSAGHNLGLIVSVYLTEREFTERDIRVMKGIAHQVSTALEQARLHRYSVDKAMELSHKIETIQVMSEIDRSILSTLEPGEILETAVRMVSRLIATDRATVALVDRESQGFKYASGFGIASIQKGALILFCDTDASDVVFTGRPQYVPDLSESGPLLPLEQKFLREGFLSHIRVPLVVKGEVIGVLNVGSKRKAAFTPEDLQTLEKLSSQISIALENARLVTDLQELFLGTVKSLSSAIDTKSPWTAGHSERVTSYALAIGAEMGFSQKELKDLELAGLLHDIGKLGTYETILDKPGRLTDEEMSIMREHPVKGAAILEPIKLLKNIRPAIKHHHEYYNGTGYPDGLKGENIPLFARVLTVADTVDAMAADRPYRKGRSLSDIMAELERCSGTQFDPKVVAIFKKLYDSSAIRITNARTAEGAP